MERIMDRNSLVDMMLAFIVPFVVSFVIGFIVTSWRRR